MNVKRFFAVLTAALLLALPLVSPAASAAAAEEAEPVRQNKAINFSHSYYMTGNPAEDIVRIAFAQLGKTGSVLGYTEEWCADFVSDCARLCKQTASIPASANVGTLRKNIIKAGGSYTTDSPKHGDICFIDWDLDGKVNHVEIIYKVENGKVYTIGGNTSTGSSLYSRCVSTHAPLAKKYIKYVVRPKYTSYTVPSLSDALSNTAGELYFDNVGDGMCVNFWPNGNSPIGASANAGKANSVSGVRTVVYMNAGDQLKFQYYYYTEENYDFFDFYVHDTRIFHRSGKDIDWNWYTYTAPSSGRYEFKWTYTKDGSNDTGVDAVMLDKISVSTVARYWPTLDEALNVPGGTLHFTQGGTASFYGDVWSSYYIGMTGNCMMPSSSATASTEVFKYAGDQLSFQYYVSSEANYDWFSFIADGETVLHLSGLLNEVSDFTYTAATTGTHQFTWQYTKDGGIDSGYDCVRLDNVRYIASPVLLGDVDLSGDVTVLDAVLALRAAMSVVTLDGRPAIAADYNRDGDITVLDAVLILRAAMGIAQ